VGWGLARQGAWLQAGAGVVAGVAVYGGVTLALGATEPRAMIALMRRRGKAGLRDTTNTE
jgi:hypothetical protein